MKAVFTLGDLLSDRAANHGAEPAIRHGDVSIDYRGLHQLALDRAGDLVSLGVQPGDRVAILLPRGIAALGWFFGILELGAVAVFINETLKSSQVGHIVENSGAVAVVGNDRLQLDGAAEAEWILNGEPGKYRRQGRTGPPPPQTGTGAIGSDIAILIYTSGSTGRPKGVMATHANLLAGARIVADYLELGSQDRTLSVLPWSFDAGLNQVLATLWAGGELVIANSAYAPDVCRLLAESAITGLAGVPLLWDVMVQRPSRFLSLQLPRLRYITNTGGAMRQSTLKSIRTAHPDVDVYLMYGLTEAFRSTYLPPGAVDEFPNSIGRAIPDTEIMVLDDAGRRCAPGQIGELVHRGPTVCAGYWNDPEATAKVFRPYRFGAPGAVPEYVVHSGDYVRCDEEGYLYFAGRRDEQFKSRGFRINPGEIEAGLLGSGLVAEAVVYAVPAADNGEPEIVAAVVPAESGSFQLEGLRQHCRTTLPPYQQPAGFRVFAAFPHTPTGKINRAAVRTIQTP